MRFIKLGIDKLEYFFLKKTNSPTFDCFPVWFGLSAFTFQSNVTFQFTAVPAFISIFIQV